MKLELCYIAIYISLMLLILIGLYKSIQNFEKRKSIIIVLVFFNLLWVVYLYFLTRNGFLLHLNFPPRFLIFIFLPALLVIIFLLNRLRKSDYLKQVPLSWPVYYQTFRVLMEQIILATALQNILPIEATYHGYNFEVYFAMTAPIVAYFAFQQKKLSKSFVVLWNIVGIMMLIIVVTIVASSFYFPELWGYSTPIVQDKFAKLPFVLLPAFMVPSAIFMHLFSILQLNFLKKT